MKTISYMVLAAAATLSLAFIQSLEPTSLRVAAYVSAWLLLPYAALAFVLMFWAKDRLSVIVSLVVIVLVAAGGLLFLTGIVLLYPDPQGGIAVLLTPLGQAVGIGVLLPFCRWMFGQCSP